VHYFNILHSHWEVVHYWELDILAGRAWKFEDDIDTDAIIPGRYLVINDPVELAEHLFEGARPQMAEAVRKGDYVVAGENFGCGSSREHAPLALKGAGISAVVAKSFASIIRLPDPLYDLLLGSREIWRSLPLFSGNFCALL